ncbi:hypothetical protein U1Q18_015675 [Sarracenia purpurea var. burkii]
MSSYAVERGCSSTLQRKPIVGKVVTKSFARFPTCRASNCLRYRYLQRGASKPLEGPRWEVLLGGVSHRGGDGGGGWVVIGGGESEKERGNGGFTFRGFNRG